MWRHVETAQRIVELEALISSKNEEIKELKEAENKLKLENEKTKEQAEKNIYHLNLFYV